MPIQVSKLGMGRRQFHAGEEGQVGTFGKKKEELQGAEEYYWTVFSVKFTYICSANRSVVDSNHYTGQTVNMRSGYLFEKHLRIT